MKLPAALRSRLFSLALVLSAVTAVPAARGINFHVLHAFDSPPDGPWSGLVQAGDGNLYGVTDSGGAAGHGTVFRVAPNGSVSVVHALGASEGSGPEGRLALGTNGWLYGTTYFGGPANAGTVFKVSTNGDFVTLASFNIANGQYPQTGLTLGPDGYFYGTTYYGGASGQGALYRVGHAGNLQFVFSFSGNSGSYPGWNAELCLANDGNLYGTTQNGGTNNSGVLFRVSTNGTVTTVLNFGGPLSQTIPHTGVVQGQDSFLYGCTVRGGDNGFGGAYKVDLLGNNFTSLGAFEPASRFDAESGMILANDGNLYTTSSSQVLKINPNGGISVVYQFSDSAGADLEGTLLQSADGDLYGTSYTDNQQDRGYIYKLTLNGLLQTNIEFVNPGGAEPQGDLVLADDGNIYGTCGADGIYGFGTMYRITPDGIFTNIYHFDETNGESPNVLINGNDGNLYGTAAGGGVWGNGTVFQISTNGVLTLIGSLDGTNGSYPSSLVRNDDGTFYGTAQFGGPSGNGAVFKLDTHGALSTLYGASVATGNYPAGMLQGLDGNLYGIAYNGPLQGGVVWQLTPGGDYNILHAFDPSAGYYPASTLTQDASGSIYGAMVGGPQALFSFATNGSFANIGTIPDYQPSAIRFGIDGNIYGASKTGGSNGHGSVWVMNRNGRLARLVSFDDASGDSPYQCPILGSDGRLYGSTVEGGPGGGGVIYAITLASPEIIAQPLTQSILQNGTVTLDVIVCSTNSVSYQWRRNGENIPGATNVSYSIANAQAADIADYSVAITSGGTTVVSSNANLTVLPPNPVLSVQLQQQTNIVLSWLAAYSGFTVQQSTNLGLNVWSPVSQSVSSNAGVFSVTVPIGSAPGAAFYRLKK